MSQRRFSAKKSQNGKKTAESDRRKKTFTKNVTPPAKKTPQEPVRINKALASAGICSRRAADELVEAGRVVVNGKILDSPGSKILPGRDSVEVDGKRVHFSTQNTYVMINKPIHTVTTAHDPEGRKTVVDILPESMKATRLFPVGRLDYFSEGLLLLTDDGDLTYRLTHPKWHLPKRYRVRVQESVTQKMLHTMQNGMVLEEGERLAPIDVRILHEDHGNTLMEMTLIQGVNRQIRRMCRDFGLTILTLRRDKQGPLLLGDLPKGEARHLTKDEVAELKKAVML